MKGFPGNQPQYDPEILVGGIRIEDVPVNKGAMHDDYKLTRSLLCAIWIQFIKDLNALNRRGIDFIAFADTSSVYEIGCSISECRTFILSDFARNTFETLFPSGDYEDAMRKLWTRTAGETHITMPRGRKRLRMPCSGKEKK